MFVTPSNLLSGQVEDFSQVTYNNYSLKLGQIIAVNYPDPSQQDGPKIITYTVSALDQYGARQASVIYYNCTLMDSFGSAADFIEYNLRSNDASVDFSQGKTINFDQDKDKLTGSMVLLLCLGGTAVNAVIIGGVRNFSAQQNTNTVDKNINVYEVASKDTGNYLKINYNGIYVNINKDGELLINRGGPTDNNGLTITSDNAGDFGIDSPDEKAPGSFIQIDKKGKITLSASDQNDTTAPHNFVTIEKDGTITLDNQGKNQIIMKDGEVDIVLSSGSNSFQIKGADDSATAQLGSGTYTVAVAEKLQQLYQQLLIQLQTLTVSTGVGPSGPPINAASFPSWDSSINSAAMKIPK